MIDIRNKLSGAFKLLLLAGRGIKHFSGTKRDGLMSFIIPVALLPFSVWFAVIYPPKGLESGFSQEAIVGYALAQSLISLAFTIAALLGVAHFLKRRDKFWLFIEASNWACVAFSVVSFVFVIAAVFGYFPRTEMDRIFAILQVYGYVVTACIAWRAFETNWQIAGAIAILTLFINQETSHLLYFMLGAPVWTGLE